MAMAVPSDLILDVMRNAPVARRSEFAARPIAGHTDSAGVTTIFSKILDDFPQTTESTDDLIIGVLDAAEGGKAADATNRLRQTDDSLKFAGIGNSPSAQASSPVAFEQMFLRNVFESFLPNADSGIYGQEVSSSGIWKSLFADNLAVATTKAGGLGIAASLVERSKGDGPVSHSQWPYFQQPVLGIFAG